jgi:hypothetical protein
MWATLGAAFLPNIAIVELHFPQNQITVKCTLTRKMERKLSPDNVGMGFQGNAERNGCAQCVGKHKQVSHQ